MRVEKARVELGIELGSAKNTERDDVEPEEQRDAGAERSIDLGVVGEARDVPAEDDGREEPHGCGDESAGESALPGLLHRRSHVIDQGSDANAARERDAPADEKRENIDRSAGGGGNVHSEPGRDEVTEDHENAGQSKGY